MSRQRKLYKSTENNFRKAFGLKYGKEGFRVIWVKCRVMGLAQYANLVGMDKFSQKACFAAVQVYVTVNVAPNWIRYTPS